MIWSLIKFISFTFLVFFSIHWFIYFSALRFLNLQAYKKEIIISLVILASGFPLMMVLDRLMYNPLTQILSSIAGIWMAYVLYLFVFFIINWVIYLLLKAAQIEAENFMYRFTLSSVIFLFLFILFGVYRAVKIEVTPVEVSLRNLPENWEGKKILQFSDIHIGWIWGNGRLEKLKKIIIQTRPELVVITGDLFDGSSGVHRRFLKGLEDMVSSSPPYGIYFTSGNHERYSGYKKIIEVVKKSGIHLLENDLVNLNGLLLAGISYPDIVNTQNPKAVYDFRTHPDYKKDLPLVLLYHVPIEFNYQVKNVSEMQKGSYMKPDTSFKTAREWKVDLQLSGHTHAGQFFPFEFFTRKIFNGFDYGLNRVGDFQIFTHAGTGTWGPPVRHFHAGEAALITLHRAK